MCVNASMADEDEIPEVISTAEVSTCACWRCGCLFAQCDGCYRLNLKLFCRNQDDANTWRFETRINQMTIGSSFIGFFNIRRKHLPSWRLRSRTAVSERTHWLYVLRGKSSLRPNIYGMMYSKSTASAQVCFGTCLLHTIDSLSGHCLPGIFLCCI